ncbi:hypothetical protein [Verrucomicrobium sp. BvORR106]|uniref:hypothetical protein n=1 Tax=Verrucomicrobium sp. BvORR106 TaxID=1403819 RepID=UPI00057176D2|nr:hypothetical protein [Verrucomicrobium sp. BvORR106]
MLRFLKLLAVYVLPVFLFDGCFNRDPAFYLDDKTELIAPWQSAPLTLSYRNDSAASGNSFQLRDVTEFLMAGSVFTGKTGEDYFIVRSSDGVKLVFSSIAKRDHALKSQFALEVSQMHPEPWYAGMRANHFYPYNLIYYAMAAVMCFGYVIFTRRRNSR